jgi:hypothetical protein
MSEIKSAETCIVNDGIDLRTCYNNHIKTLKKLKSAEIYVEEMYRNISELKPPATTTAAAQLTFRDELKVDLRTYYDYHIKTLNEYLKPFAEKGKWEVSLTGAILSDIWTVPIDKIINKTTGGGIIKGALKYIVFGETSETFQNWVLFVIRSLCWLPFDEKTSSITFYNQLGIITNTDTFYVGYKTMVLNYHKTHGILDAQVFIKNKMKKTGAIDVTMSYDMFFGMLKLKHGSIDKEIKKTLFSLVEMPFHSNNEETSVTFSMLHLDPSCLIWRGTDMHHSVIYNYSS